VDFNRIQIKMKCTQQHVACTPLSVALETKRLCIQTWYSHYVSTLCSSCDQCCKVV